MLCLTAVSASAQKFQEPTKEELQMTSDPKAPGAPAVYLYREEVTDNYNHFISEYARIKVLTELGKEWATVEVPFRSASPIIEGRTIHPDGTVVPLDNKGADLLVTQSFHNHANARVFNLPSVEVGSILEYRWTVRLGESNVSGVTDDMQPFINSALAGAVAHWDVQQSIYIHKEHFYYNPLSSLERDVLGNQSITHYTADGEIANYLLFSARLPAGAKVQASPNRDYTLDVSDVPAYVREEYAPPEASTRYNVQFYYTPYLTADVFWNDEGKRWSKEVDRFADATNDLKAAAAQITAGASSDEDKARKLYDAVQALDNTAFSRELNPAERIRQGLNRQVESAQQVWNEKRGTPRELAILYLALARAAGLQASAMAIADRRWQIFDPGYLSLGQLTDVIVVVNLGGKDVYLDPGEKMMPFEQLLWSHGLCGGLLQTVSGSRHDAVTPPNAAKDAITAHAGEFTVDATGAVTGTLKVIMNGPEALHYRQLKLTTDENELRRQLAATVGQLLPQGLNSEVGTIQGLDSSAGYLSVTVKVTGALGTLSGKKLVLPAFPFSIRQHETFVEEAQRQLPVDLRFEGQVIDDVIYHLPAGYAVESAPQPAQLPWPEHAALVVKTQTGPGTIDIKHIFARAFVLLPPADYPALRDYYQRMAQNDQQQVVLAPAAN